jgi:hypothetical protein
MRIARKKEGPGTCMSDSPPVNPFGFNTAYGIPDMHVLRRIVEETSTHCGSGSAWAPGSGASKLPCRRRQESRKQNGRRRQYGGPADEIQHFGRQRWPAPTPVSPAIVVATGAPAGLRQFRANGPSYSPLP